MELEQWIHLFGAVSSTTTAREKSKWMMFSSGLIACTVIVLIAIWALVSGFKGPASIGISVLGFLVALAWGVIQQRLQVESAHWNRLLRSIESQFAGTEFHRSIHRLLLGEQVCIPNSAWICGAWNPDATRFPVLTRYLSDRITQWVPVLYAVSFVALLVGTLTYG
ncbi:hypothetical protein ACFLSZ_05055 [Candidatus Bipolaricaulota bacterium]